MTSPKPLRQDVFISYARRDGRETAAWLFEEIKVEGLTAWQDVVALVGGEGWWKQITDAIEGTHTMVLVLTPGAMESNVVRREWAHARRVGTNILPVTRELDFYAKAPRWLGDVHGFILHPDHPDYARSRAAFFEQLRNPPKPRPIPNMAPLLPVEYVSREEQRQAMLDRLVRSVGDGKALEAQLTTLALVGEGGMGKSTLAQAICYEPEIIENYTGGILYAEIGQDAGALTIAINKVLEALNGPVVTSDRLLDQLRHELDGRMCLLVFDDVWDETIIKPYLDIPGQSYLVTTRIASVAALDSRAQPVMIRQMHTNEAAQLLLNYVPEARRPTDGPAKLTPLAQRLGEWALLLDSAGREIRAEMGQGSTLDAAIAWVNDGLHDAGLNDFQAVMDARMSASLRRFTTDEQQRLFELSIFRDDEDVPEVAAVRRWEGTAVMSKREAQKLLRRLAGQFFLRDAAGDAPVIRFHDVLHEYLAGKLGADNSKAAHAALLRSYQALTPSPSPKRGVPLGEGSLEDAANWALLPDDDYLYTHLGYHLLAAGRSDELYTLLTANRDWLDASYRALAGDHGYAA
ncbi:MAG: TIR domain-containing protein, partial [Chloroflexota bacterium]|nr:TIR domain-containing protein [Chloroflexota bacterium]